jgi:Glycosyltransferase sugar-binding region containing DXD motif
MPTVTPKLEENTANHVIQGLWIGDTLSIMERMSIASFLANGHEFHLFAYSDVKDVPAGAVLRDGNEILHASSIFRYRDNGSYAGFSNFFRYELLWKYGGWWVDLDTICLRSFQFARDYVIGSEPYAGGAHPISGVLKVPAGSPLMQYLTEVCRGKDVEALNWGETGPKLVADGIGRFSLAEYVEPTATFCPVAWPQWEEVLKPSASISLEPPVRAIHLWNELWRRHAKDKNAVYHPDCLYERLKTRYL